MATGNPEGAPDPQPTEVRLRPPQFNPANFPEFPEADELLQLTLVAAAVKEKFRPVIVRDSGEREMRQRQQRMQGTRILLERLGMINPVAPGTSQDKFAELYQRTEQRSNDLAADDLDKLMDDYEDHSAVRAIDMFRKVAPEPAEAVIMKRTLLLLLKEQSA